MKLKILAAIIGMAACTSTFAKYTTDEAKKINLQYRNEASVIYKNQSSYDCKEGMKMIVSFYDDVSMYLDMDSIDDSKNGLNNIYEFLGVLANQECDEHDRIKNLRVNTFKLSKNI